MLWKLGSAIRNYLYDIDFLSGAEFEVPIISIGNLSMGGSGKTPMTEYFILHFKEVFSIAVLSRGYRRKSSGFKMAKPSDNYQDIGDEPRQIKAKFPEINVAVGANRALAIPQVLQAAPATSLMIMDDGFQHRSVKPALNILLTPYSNPFWEDYMFPMGWLRESRNGSKRADIIIVTKCPSDFDAKKEAEVRKHIQLGDKQKLFFSSLRYHTPYQLFHPENQFEITDATTILLFTGIANGLQLNDSLSEQAKEVFWVEFDDHYNYEQNDLATLKETFDNIDEANKIILTTEKDAVRLELYQAWLEKENIKVFCLPIEVVLVGSNKNQFDGLVHQFINFYRSVE